MMQFKPGTDVAMLNAMLNVIVTEKLYDQQYIQTYVEGFDPSPKTSRILPRRKWRRSAAFLPTPCVKWRALYARAESAIIFWGMGMSQHTHGTDNARCLIALALITGQIGRPGTGLHPLRGQNNVQGASDAGLIPMFFPDYQSVENPEIRGRVESCGTPSSIPREGSLSSKSWTRSMPTSSSGMYIIGENPAMSDPDLNHAREALAHLEHLVVQDLFLTETAYLCRCLPAGFGMAGEGRHSYEHQSSGTDGKAGATVARRCQTRLVDHAGACSPDRSQLELQAPRRNLYRDGLIDALARQHPVGSR